FEKLRKLNKLHKKRRESEDNDLSKRIYGNMVTRSVNMLNLRSQETIEHFIEDCEEWEEIDRKVKKELEETGFILNKKEMVK
ncbi:unnamed protein product, partial [marine sediment metagenome]